MVEPLDDPHFDDCQAGDAEGKHPNDPSRGFSRWWLRVSTPEINKIMVIDAIETSQIGVDQTRPSMNDEDYIKLIEDLSKIGK